MYVGDASEPPLEPSQAFPNVTSVAHGNVATHSSEFVGQVVPVSDGVVVARRYRTSGSYLPSNLMVFTNLVPSMSKTIRHLLRSKALPRPDI